MTNRMRTVLALVLLAQGLAGCGGGSPSAPSPVPQLAPPPQPAPLRLATFTDPATGFSTIDVWDANDQIVRFNPGALELIWTADETRYVAYRVNGTSIRGPGVDDYFEVRFGTKNGERRAYLGWSDSWCHCPAAAIGVARIQVVDAKLVITVSNVPVPGS